MKSVALIVVLVLFFMSSLIFAEDVKNAISEKEFFQVFSGTWVNGDYSGVSYWRQKIIHYTDGRWENYNFITDDEYYHYGKYTVNDIWMDSNGNIWFKALRECLVHGSKTFVLGKISDSGRVLEHVYHESKYPTELSPIGGIYNIRYRQE